MARDGLSILSEFVQARPPKNLAEGKGKGSLSWKFSGATLGYGNQKNSLVKHINIYMEKSLKQREQLEGYLKDKDSKDKEKVVKDFQKLFDKEKEEEDE